MERENRQMLLIYALIFVIIVLIIVLGKMVTSGVTRNPAISNNGIENVNLNVNPYPTVNKECIFEIKYIDYNSLTSAGCTGGYTRYDISDVVLNNKNLKISIIYSDNNSPKTGVFVNDKMVISDINDLTKIKFGIFDNKLFIHDKTNNEVNSLAYNSNGEEVYNLKNVLNNEKIKDLSTGDTNISIQTLDAESFRYSEGAIEFNSVSNECKNGESSSGSHYKVVYTGEKFELPEFMELVKCQ